VNNYFPTISFYFISNDGSMKISDMNKCINLGMYEINSIKYNVGKYIVNIYIYIIKTSHRYNILKWTIKINVKI